MSFENEMEILTIINTVLVWLILIILVIKPYLQKFTITIDRTFWEKKPYGFHITKWQYAKGTAPNNGRGVFHFRWRNPKNLTDDIAKAKK